MTYREEVERAKKYISDHLTSGIDAKDVAARSGYSFFHFCHVFRAITGCGLASYITAEKLKMGCALLSQGRSVTFTAMECGYDTVSGFNKAFTRVYGISPSKYWASHLHKVNGSDISKGEFTMEPEIIKKGAFKASCLVIRPESEIDILENGGYWISKELPALTASSHEEAFSKSDAKIGTWMHDADGQELYYIYGDVLSDDSDTAEDADDTGATLKVIDIPEAEYAVFKVPSASTHEEFVANLRSTWKFIFNDWFDGSAYKFDVEKMDFEYYTLDGVYIYVPVLAK